MRRKRKGFGYHLYAFFAFGFFIANMVMLLLLLFHVQEIEVKGNEMTHETEIISWVKEDEYMSNSLYALWKFKHYSGELPEYLEDIHVRMILPWKLRVTVQEKQAVAAIKEEDTYVTFDKEGLVLARVSEAPKGLLILKGIHAGGAEVYDQIEVEDENVFACADVLVQELERYNMVPDSLMWDEDGISAYYKKVYVKFGKSGFGNKVLQLTAIFEELEGKKGTLHLEHYSEANQSITFEKNS